MPLIEDPEAFLNALPHGVALAGLDLGTKTIGVAVSDRLLSVASPLETIRRRKFGEDATKLEAILDARDIGGLVLGLPRNAALAGLDLGTKTIGVAVSDRLLSVASPLETIRRKKFSDDAAKLEAILDAREIGGLVLGLPRNMDGTEGPRAQSTRAFARNLIARRDYPVTFWDERLSTVAAERALLEADTTRKRRAEVIDHVAASYILQGALDRFRHLRGSAQA